MAKNLGWVLLSALSMLTASILWAQENPSNKTSSGDTSSTPKRTATVVDSSGTKTEVTNWHFGSGSDDNLRRRFGLQSSTPLVAVNTTALEIAIPEDSLISLDFFLLPAREVVAGFPGAGGKGFEVKYLWAGKEHTVKGRLVAGDFIGESDFGGFDLALDKLKQLRLNPVPAPVRDENTSQFDSALVLLDGTKVRTGHLRRQYEYSYHNYVTREQGTAYFFFDDFRFLRGEALTTVGLTSISSIEFGEGHVVTVTLKNGTKTAGTLNGPVENSVDYLQSDADGGEKGGMTHLSGIGENGWFLISPSLVKAIQFDSISGMGSK
jgi:hypothetical protein